MRRAAAPSARLDIERNFGGLFQGLFYCSWVRSCCTGFLNKNSGPFSNEKILSLSVRYDS